VICALNQGSFIESFYSESVPDLSDTIDQINKQIELESNNTIQHDNIKKIFNNDSHKKETQSIVSPKCETEQNLDTTTKNTLVNIDLKNYIHKSHIPTYPDMSRYILKSKIKPPPKKSDLTKYVLKTEIEACPNLDNYTHKLDIPDISKYILKTNIPIYPTLPNMSKYVLKSSVPPTQDCPNCPKCPKCPGCPDCPKCPTIYSNPPPLKFSHPSIKSNSNSINSILEFPRITSDLTDPSIQSKNSTANKKQLKHNKIKNLDNSPKNPVKNKVHILEKKPKCMLYNNLISRNGIFGVN